MKSNNKKCKEYIKLSLFIFFVLILIAFISVSSLGIANNFGTNIPKYIIGGFAFIYILVVGVTFKVKPDLFLLPLFACVIVVNLITVISSSSNLTTKLSGIATPVLIFLIFYFLYSVAPRVFERKYIQIFCFFFSCTILICCLYSLIFEFGNIKLLFFRESSDIVNPSNQIRSIFSSKNSFGNYIFASFILSYALFGEFSKKIKIYFIIFFAISSVFLIFTMSKTPITLIFVLACYILISKLVKLFRTNKQKSIMIAMLIVSLVVVCVLIVTVEPIYSNFFLAKYVRTAFFSNGLNSIMSRIDYLSKASSLFASPRIITGYGFKTCLDNYYSCAGVKAPLDCAYVYNILCGGILFVLVCVLIYIKIFDRVLFVKAKSKLVGERFIVLFVLLLVYGLFESTQLISSSADAFFYGLAFCTYPGLLLKELNKQPNNFKKVLHVVGSLEFGGTEAFVYNYLVEMRNKGFMFDIYCFNNINNEVKAKFESQGCKIFAGQKPKKGNLLRASLDFRKIIKKNSYGVVHLNANFDSFIYANASYDYFSANVICHAHDTLTNIEFCFVEKIIISFKRFVIKLCGNNFLACSNEAGIDIFGRKFFTTNGNVMLNGLNFDEFLKIDIASIKKLKIDYKIPDNKIVLGNITRFEEKKNQEFLLNLMENLDDRYILVLGGVDGGTLEQIKDRAKKKNNIIFIGQRNDVKNWLRIFDFYLFPSLFEGLGIVAVESQLCGLPTIVSDFVPNEADLQCGLFKKLELDIDKWADAIKIKTEKSIIDFTKESVKRYNIKICANKMQNIYERREN